VVGPKVRGSGGRRQWAGGSAYARKFADRPSPAQPPAHSGGMNLGPPRRRSLPAGRRNGRECQGQCKVAAAAGGIGRGEEAAGGGGCAELPRRSGRVDGAAGHGEHSPGRNLQQGWRRQDGRVVRGGNRTGPSRTCNAWVREQQPHCRPTGARALPPLFAGQRQEKRSRSGTGAKIGVSEHPAPPQAVGLTEEKAARGGNQCDKHDFCSQAAPVLRGAPGGADDYGSTSTHGCRRLCELG
jgi:hypothetical protein